MFLFPIWFITKFCEPHLFMIAKFVTLQNWEKKPLIVANVFEID